MTPAVVIPLLASAEFIPGYYHWNSLGQKQQGGKGANTSETEFFHVGGTWNSFMPAVPTQVMSLTITVLFSIIVVLLFFITHEIIEGKAIVAGDEVDAGANDDDGDEDDDDEDDDDDDDAEADADDDDDDDDDGDEDDVDDDEDDN